MHDGNDQEVVWFCNIQDAIGKTMYQRTPDIAPHFLPGKRKGECALNGGMNLGREIQAKAGFPRFIPFDGFVQFHLGIRVEGVIHLMYC